MTSGPALDKIYDFTWNTFCSWYIELSKTRLDKENNLKDATLTINILNILYKNIMKILHPFMPYITTAIYDELDTNKKELMLQKWPDVLDINFKEEAKNINSIKELITNIRNIRTENKVENTKKVTLLISKEDIQKEMENTIDELKDDICKMGNIIDIKYLSKEEIKTKDTIAIILSNISAYIIREDLIDKKEELRRLEKEKKEIQEKLDFTNNLLNNKGFIQKAPEEKVKIEKKNKEDYLKQLEEINKALDKIK